MRNTIVLTMLGLLAMMDNDARVSLRFLEWRTPELSIFWWLLSALLIGAVLGWAASAGASVRTRLAQRRTRRELVQSQDEVRRLRNELSSPYKLVQLIGENSWHEAATDYDAMRTNAGLREVAASADAIGPHIGQLYELGDDSVPTSTGLVRLAHEAGLTVHPYTFRVDDLPSGFACFEELVRFCVSELAVDGLFTDFPDRVSRYLRQDATSS